MAVVIDDAAVERIIAATEKGRRKAALAPPCRDRSIDRSILKDELNHCWRIYDDIKRARSDPGQYKAGRKHLADIAKYASKLRDLLERDKDKPDSAISALHRLPIPYFGGLVESLPKLEGDAKRIRDEFFHTRGLYSTSALETLLGGSLPIAYALYFHEEPGGGRAYDDPSNINSPYVRFALAAGKEFDLKLKAETILKYLYKYSSHRRKFQIKK